MSPRAKGGEGCPKGGDQHPRGAVGRAVVDPKTIRAQAE